MAKDSNVTQKEIEAALTATKRTGPVLSAHKHKQDGDIVLYLCGDKEPVRWKPPAGVARAEAPKKKAPKPKKTLPEG